MNNFLAATAPWLAPAFTLGASAVSWLELLALLLAVWMVLCNLRVNPLGWPLAMVSSALYGVLFLHSKLYGEASLQVLFIALAGWGWWQWLRGTDQGAPLQVRHLPRRAWLPVFGAGLLLWPAIGWFLDTRTPTDVPYWDAFPTAFSLIGQWLLARKYVENWPTWIGVNLVATALFAYKGLYLTVILYAIFVVLSVLGWKAWRAQVRQP